MIHSPSPFPTITTYIGFQHYMLQPGEKAISVREKRTETYFEVKQSFTFPLSAFVKRGGHLLYCCANTSRKRSCSFLVEKIPRKWFVRLFTSMVVSAVFHVLVAPLTYEHAQHFSSHHNDQLSGFRICVTRHFPDLGRNCKNHLRRGNHSHLFSDISRCFCLGD